MIDQKDQFFAPFGQPLKKSSIHYLYCCFEIYQGKVTIDSFKTLQH
jgi:hypothetical protein